MQVSKPQAVLIQTAPTQIGQHAFLGVSLGVGFRLSDPRILCHEASVWAALSQAQPSVALNETALPKQHAEWLLQGHAVYTPDARRSPPPAGTQVAWDCSVELAASKKQMRCRASQDRLLLDPRHAWRGAESENPCGTAPEAANLLLHTASGLQADALAATGPLDIRWPTRARLHPAMYGTPQEAAQDGSHLGWPAHTDLRYFQQAPQDQWLQAREWPVGAAYRLSGMGPQGCGFANTLPRLHPHAAWQAHRADGRTQPFEPIAFAQQTVWFLPDDDMGVLWWYGQIGLAYPLENRVAHLVAAVRDRSEVLDLDRLAHVARQRVVLKDHDFAFESDQLLMPALGAGWTWEQIDAVDEHPTESPQRKSYEDMRQRVDARQNTLDEVCRERKKLQERGDAPRPQPAAALVLAAEPDTWQIKCKEMPQRVLRGVVLEGQNLRAQSWQDWALEDVVFKHCDMDHSRVENGHWKNVRLEQCSLVGTVLTGLQWDQGGMASCHASQMHWDKLQLEDLSFAACDLDGTRFTHNQWKQVSLVDSYGKPGAVQDAQWDNCNLRDCTLPDWQWDQVRSKMLTIVGSDLQGLQVQRAQLSSMSVIDSRLRNSRWQACQLHIAVFNQTTQLADSHFSDCHVAESCAHGTQAQRLHAEHCSFTDFNAARLQAPQSRWTACVLTGAQLAQANLQQAVFTACSLKEARLFGADLGMSQMRHCNLMAAQTSWTLAAQAGDWHTNLSTRQVDVPRRLA